MAGFRDPTAWFGKQGMPFLPMQLHPADKVELPTIDKFVGHFYNAAQLEEMFKIFKGDPAEFGVNALRRRVI